MKNKSLNKNILNIKSNLTLFFAEYKFVLILSILFLLLGVGTGIFTAVRFSGEIALDNLADSNLVDFLKGDKGTMGLIFPYIFSFSIFFGVIIFLNFKPFMIGISCLALLIRGYLFGFDITVIIILFGFAGFLNVFIIILPFDFLICLILVVIATFAIKRNLIIRKFGMSQACKTCRINFTKTYWLFFILGILIIILKCLLLPFIRVTIIVS